MFIYTKGYIIYTNIYEHREKPQKDFFFISIFTGKTWKYHQVVMFLLKARHFLFLFVFVFEDSN